MNCTLGNIIFLESASSGLGYDSFYIIPTDGATMYFKLGSGSGSGRIQTDYWVKLGEKDEKLCWLQLDLNPSSWVQCSTNRGIGPIHKRLRKLAKLINIFAIMLLISVRPEEVWPNLSSIQGIRINLVYIVSLIRAR